MIYRLMIYSLMYLNTTKELYIHLAMIPDLVTWRFYKYLNLLNYRVTGKNIRKKRIAKILPRILPTFSQDSTTTE